MPIKAKSKTINKKRAPLGNIDEVRISIFSSFNNTIISASDYATGNTIAQSSTGMAGFKGAKKGTPYASTLTAKLLLDKVLPRSPQVFHIDVSGPGNGRDAALRALASAGVKIARITDTTALPHNGCRAKKPRRV